MDSHPPTGYLKAGSASKSGEQTSGTQRPPNGTIPSLEVSDMLPDRKQKNTQQSGAEGGLVAVSGHSPGENRQRRCMNSKPSARCPPAQDATIGGVGWGGHGAELLHGCSEGQSSCTTSEERGGG